MVNFESLENQTDRESHGHDMNSSVNQDVNGKPLESTTTCNKPNVFITCMDYTCTFDLYKVDHLIDYFPLRNNAHIVL